MRPSAPSRRSPSAAPSPVPRRSSTASPTSSGPSSTADRSTRRRPARAGCRWPTSRPTTCWWWPPRSPTPRSSSGILRTVDPSDGLVYVWTSFEPDEARRMWACFDQPDLKAPHRFVVDAPETLDGHLQHRSRDGLRGRAAAPAPGPSPTPRRCRRTSWSSTPARSTRCAAQHDGYDLGFYCRQSLVAALERDLDDLVTRHPAGAGVLRRAVRRAVPAAALRPGVRARPRRRDGELGLRHLRRRPALPHPAEPRPAGAARGVRAPRDGPHVVRRPGDHALVGRPVAQRGLRLVGVQLGAVARHRVRRPVGGLPGALQARRLRHGHGAGHATRSAPTCPTSTTRPPTSTRSPTSRARACSTS